MADNIDAKATSEAGRYEPDRKRSWAAGLDRREFLEVAGTGLLITITGVRAVAQRRSGLRGARTVEARLHVGEDGAVTVLTSKVEAGQGARTQITQAAAEEMKLPVAKVRLIMADTAVVPDDGPTVGSRTTPTTIPPVRRAAAAAREILIAAAAKQWGVERDKVEVRDGAAIERNGGRRLSYAELARSAAPANAFAGAIPPDVTVTRVTEWKVLGTPVPKIDARALVTGAHRFPSDIMRPGMLYGKVLRPPSFGATLAAIDLTPARKIEGVTVVREENFVGCAAPSSRRARKAVEAIAPTARWETTDQPSSEELFSYLKEHALTKGSGGGGPRTQTKGSVEEALAGARRVVRATYKVAYIQHVPLEPRAAVAEWEDGRLTVRTGTQCPNRVRREVAAAFHLDPDKVRIIVPDTGGGFGGKHTGEVAIEAARLAREAGRPVSVRWTRQEEFTWAYFRPAGLFEMRAGLGTNGMITAWEYTCYNTGSAALEAPYKIPNTKTSYVPCRAPLRQGSYRAIAATANNFAREAFIDELAVAAGADPVEFRLANTDDERLRAVIETAARRFRWKERKRNRKPGVGIGIAAGHEKGSYVACCVEVATDSVRGSIQVRQVCEAFECGAIQNPVNLRSQVEGCIIMGLGGALTEEIRFRNGRILNGSLAEYHVPRFADTPPIEIVLMNRPDVPSVGAGETPIIAIAPAIASAVFDAAGVRVRSMPVRLPATA